MLKGFSEIPVEDLNNYEILLITGIANPIPLIEYLEGLDLNFKHLKYPDHHNFSTQEVNKIKETFEKIKSNKKIILTTEKDYVRIFADFDKLYYISIKVAFIGEEKALQKRIKNYVG